ncbi:T9SS type A sorting domain-containing protein [Candidatus Poribacteria bacterium]|nr:T9SS type A sorting domain-containing protein [Candidatus Poribacteria bacterium]
MYNNYINTLHYITQYKHTVSPKMKSYPIYIIILFIALLPVTQALPPDPELHSAIETARSFTRLKPRYTPNEIVKCATDSFVTIAKNWQNLPSTYRNELKPIFLRPGLPGSFFGDIELSEHFDTPHFRLHYTRIGPHAPPLEDFHPRNGVPDYVDLCADAMERAYHIQIDLMKFKKPYIDFWAAQNGGNHKYDVYIFTFPALGIATADWFEGRVLSTALTVAPYFMINSRIYDYVGKAEGIRYLETTCAHEFLHGIQFAYNAYMPTWFMEASATWIEVMTYDGGVIDDGDTLPDPDEINETNSYNYYIHQLRRWFMIPDISLESRIGDHEYGSVIWALYMAERFGYDIIRQFYNNTTDGSYREFGNFYEVFIDNGTTLAEAFKTFTVWNYFTHTRANTGTEIKGYRNAERFPPVAIHPNDIHSTYPIRADFNSESMPEHFSSRYFVFRPSGIMPEFAVKIDGADLGPIDMSQLTNTDRINIERELRRHTNTGLRGWAAKFIVKKSNGTTEVREAFTYQRSQDAQMTFTDFGSEIREIVLILINMHPDVEQVIIPGGTFGGSVSVMAGTPPTGQLSNAQVSQGTRGPIIRWSLDDLTGIQEIVIVRKRYELLSETDMPQPFQNADEVRAAVDSNGDGIAEDTINIVGRVPVSQIQFEDTTVFQDIDVAFTDPNNVHYYYAVVPVDTLGIMGTPSIVPESITPSVDTTNGAPAFFINTQPHRTGEWHVEVQSTHPLQSAPQLTVESPNRENYTVFLTQETATKWRGTLRTNGFPQTGIYLYKITGQTPSGVIGNKIWQGRIFNYVANNINKTVLVSPNPIRAGQGNQHLTFYPNGLTVEIYDVTGNRIKVIENASNWDCTNQNGEKVCTGLYFFRATDDNGFQSTGKFSVVK